MFFIVEMRPDITFAIFIVSQFTKNPSHQHNKIVKTIFWYLKAPQNIGITYRREQRGDLIIKEYFDFN